MNIQTVTIVGANGTIGSKIGGLIAAFSNARVFMMARTKESAEIGIQKAMASVRSSVIEPKFVSCTLDQADHVFSESDWIFESVMEDFDVKKSINTLINRFAAPGCIVTTGTSGMSVNSLAESFSPDIRKRYWGTHFFNPPLKMTACEVIQTKFTDKNVAAAFQTFLTKTLHRTIVPINSDRAAFAGNYVGFRLFEMAVNICEQNADRGGIDYVDSILGNVAGNTMAPLTTLDYVGLDVYQSIVENIHDRIFNTPAKRISGFVRQLIHDGHTGVKKQKGVYDYSSTSGDSSRRVWDLRDSAYRPVKIYSFQLTKMVKKLVRYGRYTQVMSYLISQKSNEAELVLEYILSYIVFSFELVPEVVSDIEHVNSVMMNGFAWAPPTFWLKTFLAHQKMDLFIDMCAKFNILLSKEVLAAMRDYLRTADDKSDLGYRYFTVGGMEE